MSTPPCRYFALGTCRNGDSCYFSHAAPEPEDPKAALKAKMAKLQAEIEARKKAQEANSSPSAGHVVAPTTNRKRPAPQPAASQESQESPAAAVAAASSTATSAKKPASGGAFARLGLPSGEPASATATPSPAIPAAGTTSSTGASSGGGHSGYGGSSSWPRQGAG